MVGNDVEKARTSSASGTVEGLPNTPFLADNDVIEGGLKGRLCVLGAFCALYCSFGQLNAFGIFQSWYAEHQMHDLPPSTISWIGSLQLWVFFFSGGFVGRIYDEYGPRILMSSGTIILVFSIMMTSISTSYYEYVLCQGILFGLGVGLLFYPSLAAISTHFQRYRATAVGMAMSGSGLGGVLYPIMFRQLFTRIGFGWSVRISGFVTLALCAISLALVTSRSRTVRSSRPWFDRDSMKDIRFMIIVFASVFISFGLFIPYFYITDYAIARSVSPVTAFYVLAIMNAGSIPGRLFPPLLSDRLGRFNLIVPCVFLSGLLTLALWSSAKSLSSIIAFSVLFGFFSGGFNALIISCVAQISDITQIGTRVGLLYTVISFPSLGGGPAAGALLKSNHGSFTGLIILSGTTITVGSFFMLCARFKIEPRWTSRI